MKRKSILNILFFCLGFSALFVFASCTNEIEIKQTNHGTYLKYKILAGTAFTKTITSITGEEESQIFNRTDITKMFEQTGLEEVKVVTIENNGFMCSAKLSQDKKDMISKSGIVYDEPKKLAIALSQPRLTDLYDNLSSELANYIDLFMAPSFTGETMTNDEYLDLLSSVYGEELTTELKKAKVKVSLVTLEGTSKKFSVDLINLLNLTGTLIME